MQIGTELRRIRKTRRQTLSDVSASTGLSVSYLSMIERDKTVPSFEVLKGLARHYGTTLHHLLPKEEERTDNGVDPRPGFGEFLKQVGSMDGGLKDLLLRVDNQAQHPARTKDDWMRYYYSIQSIINYAPAR